MPGAGCPSEPSSECPSAVRMGCASGLSCRGLPQLLLRMVPVFSSLNCCRSSRGIFTAWYWGTVASGYRARLKNPICKNTRPDVKSWSRCPAQPSSWPPLPRGQKEPTAAERRWVGEHLGQQAAPHHCRVPRVSFTARERPEGAPRSKRKDISYGS